jgi:hypothetical protein
VPTVFIINRSAHNFSEAEKYGTLVFLTEGLIDADNLNLQTRMLWKGLSTFKEGDYILLTGLASSNLLVGYILGTLKKDLNILLYVKDKYVIHRLTLKNFLEGTDKGTENSKEAEREIKLWFRPEELVYNIFPTEIKEVKIDRIFWK